MEINLEDFYYKKELNNISVKYDNIYILVSLNKYLVFYELSMMLSNTLNKMGYKNSVLVNDSDKYVYDDNSLYIIYGIDDFNYELLPNKFIIYQFEQLWRVINYCNLDIINDMFNVFNKAICIWEYSNTNLNLYKYFNKLKVPIYFVPLGYDSYIDYQFNYDYLKKDKDINISFVGQFYGRRQNIINNINKIIPVSIYNNNVWNISECNILKNASKCDTKAQVFLRSKIIINIYMFEPIYSSFDLYRIITSISNKCLVISEYSRDIIINKIFEPYIILCDKEDFSNKIKYYIDNEKERINKVNCAYDWLNTKFKYDKFIPKECLIKIS